MVTLDDKLVNPGTFDENLKKGRKSYERAKQGSELVEREKSLLEERLKERTGFSSLNLPAEPTETRVSEGDVTFVVRSEATTPRPSYKTAVESMVVYLNGVYYVMHSGAKTPWAFQQGELTFVEIGKLFEDLKIIVNGIFLPGVRHTIIYEISDKLAAEKPLDELVLKEGRNSAAFTPENFATYVRMDRLEPILTAYVEDYEAELAKGQRGKERVTPVTSRSAYETTRTKAKGPNWTYVVKTLITVPTDTKSIGELDVLSDPSLSKAEKERRFPHYDLAYRGEEPRLLYVSVQSVAKRIESLKEGPGIQAKGMKVKSVEIV